MSLCKPVLVRPEPSMCRCHSAVSRRAAGFRVVTVLAFGMAMFATMPKAGAEDHQHPGHAQFHNTYKGWVQSNGFSSCCNGDDPATGVKGDCRPAKAYQDPDDNLWRVLINGMWRTVPPQAVRPYPTPDGNSHVCEDEYNGIMCFVGGLPKG